MVLLRSASFKEASGAARGCYDDAKLLRPSEGWVRNPPSEGGAIWRSQNSSRGSGGLAARLHIFLFSYFLPGKGTGTGRGKREATSEGGAIWRSQNSSRGQRGACRPTAYFHIFLFLTGQRHGHGHGQGQEGGDGREGAAVYGAGAMLL